MNFEHFVVERQATLERRIVDLKQQLGFAETELQELKEIDPKSVENIPQAFAHLTVRQLILRAFVDSPQFREKGASNGQIIAFFGQIYGRNVLRTTLSPQLSKNREAGYLRQHEGRWHVTKSGLEVAARS